MTEINDKEGKPLDMKQAFQELIDGAAAFRHYNPVQCNICKGTGKFGLIKKDEDESCFACNGTGRQRCAVCGGEGVYSCAACYGTGREGAQPPAMYDFK